MLGEDSKPEGNKLIVRDKEGLVIDWKPFAETLTKNNCLTISDFRQTNFGQITIEWKLSSQLAMVMRSLLKKGWVPPEIKPVKSKEMKVKMLIPDYIQSEEGENQGVVIAPDVGGAVTPNWRQCSRFFDDLEPYIGVESELELIEYTKKMLAAGEKVPYEVTKLGVLAARQMCISEMQKEEIGVKQYA